MIRQPLLIMGSGGLVAEATDIAEDMGTWQVEGFVSEEKIDLQEINGRPVYPLSDVAHLTSSHQIVCAQVDTNRHHFITRARAMDFQFGSLIHPSAHISKTATIGKGVIVGANAVILSYACAGDFSIVLSNATLSHHVQLGRCSNVTAGVTVAGLSHIGSKTFIGINASVLPESHIGDHCFVGAGSVVNKYVPSHKKAVGNPVKIYNRRLELHGLVLVLN